MQLRLVITRIRRFDAVDGIGGGIGIWGAGAGAAPVSRAERIHRQMHSVLFSVVLVQHSLKVLPRTYQTYNYRVCPIIHVGDPPPNLTKLPRARNGPQI